MGYLNEPSVFNKKQDEELLRIMDRINKNTRLILAMWDVAFRDGIKPESNPMLKDLPTAATAEELRTWAEEVRKLL